jgi:hypothetical protein
MRGLLASLILVAAPACRCATLPDAEWACATSADCPSDRPRCVGGHCQAPIGVADGGTDSRAGMGGVSVGPASAVSSNGRFRAQGSIELPITGTTATSDGGRFRASGGFVQ